VGNSVKSLTKGSLCACVSKYVSIYAHLDVINFELNIEIEIEKTNIKM